MLHMQIMVRGLYLDSEITHVLINPRLFLDGDEAVGKSRVEALFRGNYPRLQQLKKKYDPEMIFNKWFPIEPAH